MIFTLVIMEMDGNMKRRRDREFSDSYIGEEDIENTAYNDYNDAIKGALEKDVNYVYKCVMEIFTICKKSSQDKDVKIKTLQELKVQHEQQIEVLQQEIAKSKSENELKLKELYKENNKLKQV